jgi:hypothetical protein
MIYPQSVRSLIVRHIDLKNMQIYDALFIMLGAFTIGLIGIFIEIVLMGIIAIPGDLLVKLGRKLDALLISIFGLILTVIGQLYIVAAYSICVVALLHYTVRIKPDIPTWPLWIAVYIHSVSAPNYGLKRVFLDIKDRQFKWTKENCTLISVALFTQVLFLVIVYNHIILRPFYAWIPYFGNLLK